VVELCNILRKMECNIKVQIRTEILFITIDFKNDCFSDVTCNIFG